MTLATQLLDRAEGLLQLKLALSRALNNQEKHWGYFQTVRGDDGVLYLDIPHLPQLKFVQNPERDNYKIYWGRTEKPSVYIRKKKKTVTERKTGRDIVQRVYEIFYQVDGRSSVRIINRLLASEIRDRVADRVSTAPEGELEPLVLLSEAP
ncbi:MAG: hypothetical protein J7641_13910 [Cyanobacteria bacterium SID2]|nr:hypothetical protein [Cyanobacteria bacterium SID2]MBP0002803.1 hypothetical protein [Cyanobacteria bacterium SBC]